MRAYLFIVFVSAIVSYLVTPMVRRVAERGQIFAALRARDVHSVPTPRLGGVAIFCGVMVGLLMASCTPFLEDLFEAPGPVIGVAGAAALLCLLGVIDDIWDLHWLTKLAGQTIAAGFMALNGVALLSIPFNSVIIGSSRMSLVLTVLVVLVTINAVNFVDGLDGLAAGVVTIGGSAFFVYSYMLARATAVDSYANLASLIISVLIGACIGFLPHNFNPSRIFMGDSGSMLIGLLLAASTIRVTGQVDPAALASTRALPTYLPILLPLAVMALPLIDLLLAVVRRMAAGKSPFTADAKHLHHRMLRLGHSHAHAVLIMYLWTAVVAYGCVAFLLFDVRYVVAGLVIALLATLLLTFYPLLRRRRVARALARKDS
ncbi:undecaprenyl/decaprenyl-phosphate alpha-N-acetylglucosaminyl 1-phosphate transferase [Brevibacterium sp. 50QC2O2]|uniref:MraY family glycosyltransferase n=1 Tax=Brevibacterium TaxID=1696 RepID=UPI00211D0A24|nr:undecaprenyl/decaprenyl-phosphate alpha-N-acetylglucosaminyl 1-phosphate transferase [Brevibacterium sp. 91QC2O2]MCQ9384795.1 undecaprenyl/decaprenyl-phosphate alpha-N-acetylglucosaminyl 1-phosphate transferase [Brevibacterium sp. 68QC2CO]MCQ9387557.1 undecaprenyl/decaprenyl-phosphate alpha-N-acetylglucosaminyl 1-phosphate transferase [Brevibacterium sp. 50QC2O2]